MTMAKAGSSRARTQISQQTFDEVVQENVDEFDMSAEEATRDAIEQFVSQGVDLSNIIKHGLTATTKQGDADRQDDHQRTKDGSSDPSVSTRTPEQQLRRLLDLLALLGAYKVEAAVAEEEEQQSTTTTKTAGPSHDAVLAALDELLATTKDVPEIKVVAGRHDGIARLLTLLSVSVPHLSEPAPYAMIAARASQLLSVWCLDNTDNQDFVQQSGLETLARLLRAIHGNVNVSTTTNDANDADDQGHAVAIRVLTAVRVVCAKHERNKAHFAKAHGVDAVCLFLPTARNDEALSRALARLLRVLTINDDPSATFSQAADTIKLVVAKFALIPYMLDTIALYVDSSPELLTAWLVVLKQVAITEEHCQQISELHGLELVFRVLSRHARHLAVATRCVTVFRNLAAADALKGYLLSSGGAAQLLEVMQHHVSDVAMQQHACATLAALALRSPAHSHALVLELGAVRPIAMAMRAHAENTALLRQASLAVRNLVARAPELRERILDEDVEPLLRKAQHYRGCGDEAYAALRDLGCEIQLSTYGLGVQTTSSSVPMAFNPVQIASGELLDAVDEAAEAPFAR